MQGRQEITHSIDDDDFDVDVDVDVDDDNVL